MALVLIAVLRARATHAWRPIAAGATTFAALFVLRAALLHQLWGTWVTTRLAYGGTWGGPGFQIRGVILRATGLLIDQEYGLLIYAPIFVLAVPGLVRLWRTHRAAWVTIVVVGASYLLFVLLPLTNPYGWTGAWSPPARFLVPILPFLVVAVAAAIPVVPRAVLVPLIVLQLTIDAYVWQHPKNLWNDSTGTAAICTRGGLPVCRWLPSLTRFGP
jgi:hypothetical protein